MQPCYLKQIDWSWFCFKTSLSLWSLLFKVPASLGEFHPNSLYAFFPSLLTEFVIPPAYQGELRQRGSDSSLLILQQYFSISMECLSLFSQCCVTAGMPVCVGARVGLRARQASQEGNSFNSPAHHPSQSPSQLPAACMGTGINKEA